MIFIAIYFPIFLLCFWFDGFFCWIDIKKNKSNGMILPINIKFTWEQTKFKISIFEKLAIFFLQTFATGIR